MVESRGWSWDCSSAETQSSKMKTDASPDMTLSAKLETSPSPPGCQVYEFPLDGGSVPPMSVLVGRACSNAQMSWSSMLISGRCGEDILSGCSSQGVPCEWSGDVEGLGGRMSLELGPSAWRHVRSPVVLLLWRWERSLVVA